MTDPALIDKLKSLTVTLAAAVDGAQNCDLLKVELALAELQKNTDRLLKEIANNRAGRAGSR